MDGPHHLTQVQEGIQSFNLVVINMPGANGRRVGGEEPAMCPQLRVWTINSRNREKKGAGDKWDNQKNTPLEVSWTCQPGALQMFLR